MLHDIVKKGSVDRSVTVRIIDSTDGTPETGVVYDTAGIDLWYRREGAAVVSITEATLAALTTAHTDGGFLTISHGYYRLDPPDAAFATGANHVDFGGTVTGMVVIGGRVRLVDYDPEDTVRMGLTALPNNAANAAGGLPISAAGALSMDGIKSDTDAILVDTGTTLDGRIPAALGADGFMKASVFGMMGTALTETAGQIAAAFKQFFNIATPTGTTNLIPTVTTVTNAPTDMALNSTVAKDATVGTAANQATILGYIDTEVAAILAAVDTEVAAIKVQTDKLAFTVANKVDANVLVLNGDATAAANLAKSASVIYQGSVTGAAATTTLIDSALTQAAADFWKGRIVIFTSGTLKYQATDITAFDPATDKLTFTALTGTPALADAYVIV